MLYDRRHTYEIKEYGGLATPMPVYATFFLVITLSSIGLPLMNGFVGEFSC
jgi:NADH-quinone oxidoreductase subunit M